MQTNKTYKGFCLAFAVIAAIALGLWICQQFLGLGITGMGNQVSWGLYITNFMFFVGLSAGGLIVASSAHVFNIERFKPVALPAVIVSTVCICIAGAFVLVDLGGITRLWSMLISPNVSSPLVWDMSVIMCYLIINILDLYWMCSKKADPHKVEVLSRIALPVAILVHSVTAWIFGLEIGREGWHSAIMAPIFVASAMDSGLALLILVLLGMKKTKLLEFGTALQKSISGLLATCIAIDAYLVFCEILTVAYAGTESGNAILKEMTTGATAPFFWIEIIMGLAIPFCILVFSRNREKSPLVAFAAVLVVIGVFCKRVWLLFTSFINANISGAPGIPYGTADARDAAGSQAWSLTGSYLPTLPEVCIVIGVISLGALVFMILVKKLMKPIR